MPSDNTPELWKGHPMAKSKTAIIHVQDTEINVTEVNQNDYISLTDIAKYRDTEDTFQIIANWMRLYGTVSYLGLWEQLNNPNFKPYGFERFKSEAGREYFSLTPKKWIGATDAIGIVSKSGRYGGGTFAHSDLAFKFAAWISPEFELYLIREFKRLIQLNQVAITQLTSLLGNAHIKQLASDDLSKEGV
jgi:hypothetical protein